jgi:ribonuclease HI
MCYIWHLHSSTINNMVKYDVLIEGLKFVISLKVHQLLVKEDSHLVINQVHRILAYNNASKGIYRQNQVVRAPI